MREAVRCPACGGDDLEVTTLGAIVGPDPNVFRCETCGRRGPESELSVSPPADAVE